MVAKTERITILGTPDFKDFLGKEAEKEGVSVSELVRSRCANTPANMDDIVLLQSLIKEVNTSTRRAEKSLQKGLNTANDVLKEIREARA